MAINDKYIKGPFKADFLGGIIWGGSDNFHFADVRGWGQLSYEKDGAKIQDANLQFMVDALNEKASGALKKAGDEIADLAHPEFGEMGRLQEEIHELKKEVEVWKKEHSQAHGNWLETRKKVTELEKEVEWLRYYKKNVYQCLGPADDEINRDIRRAYVKEVGLDALPEKLRIEHLEYEDDHKET